MQLPDLWANPPIYFLETSSEMRTYSVSILINILLQLLDDVVEISEIKIRPFDHIDEKDDG